MSQRKLVTSAGGGAFDSPAAGKRSRDDALSKEILRSGPASAVRDVTPHNKRRRKQDKPVKMHRMDSPATDTPRSGYVDQLIKPAKQTPLSQSSMDDDLSSLEEQDRKDRMAIRRGPQGALEEIKYYQKKTGLLIARLPFARVVKEETIRLTRSKDFKWQSNALEALQEASEAYVCAVLSDAYLCSLHAKRVTLMVRDIQLARRIRGD